MFRWLKLGFILHSQTAVNIVSSCTSLHEHPEQSALQNAHEQN